jgi:hypothetical protein
MTDVQLPRLYERDIDVLLQEELVFNRKVCEVISEALRLKGALCVQQCRLSVVDQTGETDLFAHFSIGDQQGVLLIENKIDAAFQPHQPERYRERAAKVAREHGSELIYCVLVSPARFNPGNEALIAHFDTRISYEDLAAAIAAESTPRAEHRARLLLRAVEQARSPYILTPSVEVTSMWERIFDLANNEFPLLRMKAPNSKGGQSWWVIFKADLPARITIDWKIKNGVIDLSFWKGAVHAPSDAIDLSTLPAGSKVTKLGDTVAVRVPMESSQTNWVNLSDKEIRAGLTIAHQLLRFYKEQEKSFR